MPSSSFSGCHWLRQCLQHPQPLPINLVINNAFPRLPLPSRKLRNRQFAEQRQIARNRIDLRLMRRNNHERPRTRSRHSRSHQRARRPPDSAERPAMPRFEAGDHIGKAAMNTQISGQLPQPASGQPAGPQPLDLARQKSPRWPFS